MHKELNLFSLPNIFLISLKISKMKMSGHENWSNSLWIFKCGFCMIDNIIWVQKNPFRGLYIP